MGIRLLSNTPMHIPALEGFGLEVVEQVAVPSVRIPGGWKHTDFAAAGVEGAWLAATAENARSVCVEIHGYLGELDKRTIFEGFLACGGA